MAHVQQTLAAKTTRAIRIETHCRGVGGMGGLCYGRLKQRSKRRDGSRPRLAADENDGGGTTGGCRCLFTNCGGAVGSAATARCRGEQFVLIFPLD